jgi:hypothetical protein
VSENPRCDGPKLKRLRAGSWWSPELSTKQFDRDVRPHLDTGSKGTAREADRLPLQRSLVDAQREGDFKHVHAPRSQFDRAQVACPLNEPVQC